MEKSGVAPTHQTRTEGDGMENNATDITKLLVKHHSSAGLRKLMYRPSETTALRPVVPEGKVVTLVPKYVPRKKKNVKFVAKPKEPRFVPYEPYRAAVEPIVSKKKVVRKEISRTSKNNIDIQDLVSQMSEMTAAELTIAKIEALENDEPLITKRQWDEERKSFENDIKNLRETNTHLENQLKFQAQVNSELKTLLVAAVGEDLESRVQHLTEDKLQLARALLNSANHLTSHQEHTEWLSGQCEVWRSKFLASSLMVEELARWKKALTSKNREFQNVLKQLLDEREKVRELSHRTFSSLSAISEHIKAGEPALRSGHLLELAETNKNLGEIAEQYLLKGMPNPRKHRHYGSLLTAYTPAEKSAVQALKEPVALSERPDVLCNAVMGVAVSVSGGQMFLQHPSVNATCCAHCKGEVKNV